MAIVRIISDFSSNYNLGDEIEVFGDEVDAMVNEGKAIVVVPDAQEDKPKKARKTKIKGVK